jgi:hypothetical protein
VMTVLDLPTRSATCSCVSPIVSMSFWYALASSIGFSSCRWIFSTAQARAFFHR